MDCRFSCDGSGLYMQVLQKLMRHHNIELTMRFYANVDDAMRQAVLGQRNEERNNRPRPADGQAGQSGASPSQGTASDA